LWEARAAWRRIGGELNGISEGDLEAFEMDHDPSMKLTKVLTQWMHGNRATIYELLDALEGEVVSRKDLAEKIRSGDKNKYGLD